ncbi:hypothetical protein [Streptomyces sp. NBC_01363]|uniref:hypothetical protein n=1 Tax=Streptomyces sp. NBC_01363 TaxID=2903840 RepID=UPI00224DC8D6|nr:hypothetical protein [Streptomyces sp. NBC_01363]MCX4736746.1 hypothetical protein [Streptomyces sp. NBC_01363]
MGRPAARRPVRTDQSGLLGVRAQDRPQAPGTSVFRRTLSSPDFQQLLGATGAGVDQIQCSTDGVTLLNRSIARASSAERHPGHCDDQNVDEFRGELLAGRYEPLDLLGPVLTVDTTRFDDVDIDALATQVSALLP